MLVSAMPWFPSQINFAEPLSPCRSCSASASGLTLRSHVTKATQILLMFPLFDLEYIINLNANIMKIYPDGIILIGSIEESMSALKNAYSFIYGIHLLHHQHPISTSLYSNPTLLFSLFTCSAGRSISHSLFFDDSLQSTTSQQHARWFDRSCDRTTLQSSTSQQHLCQSSPPGTLLPASTLQTHRLISLIQLLDQE